MDKTQEKFLKLLDLINGCREKLYGTYNLFVSYFEQAKATKADIASKYDEMLGLREESVQLAASGRPSKMRMKKIDDQGKAIVTACEEQISSVHTGMSDSDTCRKTYKHEVALCCDTYKQLGGAPEAIDKGYKQQIKMIRKILEKIDSVKVGYKAVREQLKEQLNMLIELYNKLTDQTLQAKA